MTETSAAPTAPGRAWTCPFCPLACDHVAVSVAEPEADTPAEATPLALIGDDCPRASRALARFSSRPSDATPTIDGRLCDLETAVTAAAGLIGASRQPLFGGLGTDVAGARSLYRLACASGAICDSANGDALTLGLRALQDRGQFTTTLAEVRTRADLIVFIGGLPLDVAPLIAQRCGIGDAQVPSRHVVVLGGSAADDATLAAWAGLQGVTVESLPLQGDLFDTLALLSASMLASVNKRPLPDAPPHLLALAARLRQAHYAVLVGAAAKLPVSAQSGALIIEAVNQVVGALNRNTRAASLWIGGGDGAATVNQVFAWLSGLPLRSRAGPLGLEHEPLLYGARRLLDDHAVDSLLWVSTFDADAQPAPNHLPMIVIGHPALAATLGPRAGLPTIFIPVATPGIGAAGHVFRTDGTVLMPLFAVYRDLLPSAADVLDRIDAALAASKAGSTA